MKTLKIVPLIALIFFTSCYSFQQIGEVNMISHRNIDASHNYVLLVSYVGGTDEERKSSRAETIQEAIDNTVQKVPGGEYLMNAKIYEVIKGGGGKGKTWFAAEGDVWGEKQEGVKTITAKSTYSFNTGDHVTWKHDGKWYTGTIISSKDMNSCIVKVDNDGDLTELNYNDLSKIDNPQQTNSSPDYPNVEITNGTHTQSSTQPSVQIKLGDKIVWQDINDKKFYTGIVVGQGNGTWLIKDDDDSKIYPVNYSQVYLSK